MTNRTNRTTKGLDGFDDAPATKVSSIPTNIISTTISTKRCKPGIYDFQPEPSEILTSSLKNNPMSGITFFRLCRLLFLKRHTIDWWRYKHRILALFCMGIFNSFLSILEFIYVYIILMSNPRTRKILKIAWSDSQAPVFILGHPRTGTTLLHSLLALDEERFTYCTTFMSGFPHCFLFFENIGKYLFAGILSETRPMDNMKLHFDLPQEDELATNLLSGFLVSPYTSISFMRDERMYRKYQCFRDDNTSTQDITIWSKWFCFLLQKIKIRDMLRRKNKSFSQQPRQLLLKSPCHTGRARLLVKLFPNAKFVFIHRNPYELFLSGAHMASTTYGYWFLQQPSNEQLQEYILAQGEILHNEYFSSRDDGILHEKNCAEISFEELTKDPIKSIQQIYNQLGFTSFDTTTSNSIYPKRLTEECQVLKGYKRNQYKGTLLDDELKKNIQERWSNQFNRFEYDL